MFDLEKQLREIRFQTQSPGAKLKEQTRALVYEEIQKKERQKKTLRCVWQLSPVAVVLMIVIMLFNVFPLEKEICYYTIDINPSLSVAVDAQDRVLSVSAENEDAEMLLRKLKLKGLLFEKALYTVVQEADTQGFLKEDSHVLVAHFGGNNGITQQRVENVVSGATEYWVKALLIESTKDDYEVLKKQNGHAGLELLKQKADDMGVSGQDVDTLIAKIKDHNKNSENQNAKPTKNAKTPEPTAKPDKFLNNNGNHGVKDLKTGNDKKEKQNAADNKQKPDKSSQINADQSQKNNNSRLKNEKAEHPKNAEPLNDREKEKDDSGQKDSAPSEDENREGDVDTQDEKDVGGKSLAPNGDGECDSDRKDDDENNENDQENNDQNKHKDPISYSWR